MIRLFALYCSRSAQVGQNRATGSISVVEYAFAVGTTGSATLVSQTVLPALLRNDALSLLGNLVIATSAGWLMLGSLQSAMNMIAIRTSST